MNESSEYSKQTLFILSNSQMKGNDSAQLLKAKLFFKDSIKEGIDQPFNIANFPYLAMCKIKIPKGKSPPSIQIQFQIKGEENHIIYKTIKPHFSSVISMYISINSSKPDLEDFKYLYRNFLFEKQNSYKTPSKESLKVCRSFILKKSKYSYFAPFFLAASYYLTDPIPIQYVQLYSKLRINGRVRSINELVDYSMALYSFLVNEKTQQMLLIDSKPKIIKGDDSQNNNNNNDDDDDNGSINLNEDNKSKNDCSETDDDFVDLSTNQNQTFFRKLLKGTISDILKDLEKAELHGPHSSILFLACFFTNVFKKNNSEFVLPKKWHFLPIELINRSQNDQKHTGRFLSDNFSFVETSVSNNALSAISCYSPLFHNDIKNLTKTITTIKHGFQVRDVISLAGLKLQQLDQNIRQAPKKLNFVYFYPMPNPDYVKRLFEIVSIFNLKSREKGNPSTELIAEQKFAQLYWRTIFHYIPNRALFPAIVPKPLCDQNNSLKTAQISQAYDNFNKIVKEHINEPNSDFYQQFYNFYLKNMLSL